MTETEFVRELDGSYLLIRTDEPGDEFAGNMIMTARPAHLLPLRSVHGEERKEYRYDISGLKSLSSRLSAREIEAAEIRELIRGIYRVLCELEDHLLEPGSLFLEPGLIFCGPEGYLFCCLPGRKEEIYAQMQPLSRYLLKKGSHEDPDTSALVYTLFELCHEENTSFAQLLEAVTEQPAAADQSPEKRGLFGLRRRKRR